MSRLSTDGSVSGLLAWLICWNIFHYWSGKQRLFFWKIGMQRQIWPQHCRCIKHFGRGINVVLLHRRCCFSLETKLSSPSISVGKIEQCWRQCWICSSSHSSLGLIHCICPKTVKRRALKPLLHLMKMKGYLETSGDILLLVKGWKKHLSSMLCIRQHFGLVSSLWKYVCEGYL